MDGINDIRTVVIDGATARDYGKRFKITEVDPLTLSGFVLRLVSALRVDSYEDLLGRIKEDIEAGGAPIDLVMSTLTGCDPKAVHALVAEALEHVECAVDPRHPEAFRRLLPDDIRDLPTLGAVLLGFVKLNFSL